MRTQHWEWWGIGCVMALAPLGAWILTHYLVGQRGALSLEATRELLFFALSVASTAVLALLRPAQRERSPLWMFITLLITIASAVTYGGFLVGEALHAVARLRNAYTCALALTAAGLMWGAVIQGLTTKEGFKK